MTQADGGTAIVASVIALLRFGSASLWEFDGGRARRGWIFTDVASLMAQLGMA